MNALVRRLSRLEKTNFAPAVTAAESGRLANFRNSLLRGAKPYGHVAVDQLRAELDQLGPCGLWRETVRCHLSEHGYAQRGDESFAETIARALGVSTRELRNYIGKAELAACWRTDSRHWNSYRY